MTRPSMTTTPMAAGHDIWAASWNATTPLRPEPGGEGERVAADDAHEDGHHRRHQGGGAGHLGEVEAGAVDVGRAAQDDRVEDHDVGHREEGGQAAPELGLDRRTPLADTEVAVDPCRPPRSPRVPRTRVLAHSPGSRTGAIGGAADRAACVASGGRAEWRGGPRSRLHGRLRRDRRRRPHAPRPAHRPAAGLAPGRPGGRGPAGPGHPQRPRPRADRRRHLRLLQPGGGAGPQRGPQRGPGRRLPRVGAGHHRRPPVRVVPAGDPLRGPGGDGRRLRRGGGGRGGVDEPGAHGLGHPQRARPAVRTDRCTSATCRRAGSSPRGSPPSGWPRRGTCPATTSTPTACAATSGRRRPPTRAGSTGRSCRSLVDSTRARPRCTPTRASGRDTSLEALAGLKPAFETGGRITAGNSSQITDGAAAVLIMSEERAAALGLRPRARLVAFAVVGVDPVMMLTGAHPGHRRRCCARAGLGLADIDRFEVNEAFASVVLAWAAEHRADPEQGQRQRRGHRPRPSPRVLGRPPHRHPAGRARAQRRPLRAADHVRGWRHGQRPGARAAGSAA